MRFRFIEKILISARFFLFLFLFLAFLNSSSRIIYAKAIVPEDVLTNEEIDRILASQNLFFRNDKKYDLKTWNRWHRKYSKHFFGKREQYFSLNEVQHKVLSDGFPIRYKLRDLFRTGMDIHVAWGSVIPRLNISLGEGLAPINLNSMFVGLFGFLMPQHWLQLKASYRAYEAAQFLFLKTALDEVLNAELYYLKIHQSIHEFEIINFYFVHLQLLARIYPEAERTYLALAAKYSNDGSYMALKRSEVVLNLDDLAQIMALERDHKGNYSLDSINIKNLRRFPGGIEDVENWRQSFGEKENFIQRAVSKSVELKAIREFYEIAKLNVGVTAFGSIFGDDTTGQNTKFGIHLGYDTMPRILQAKSDRKEAKIDVQKEYFNVLMVARRAHDLYTSTVELLAENVRNLETNRSSFHANLSHILDDKQPVDAIFLFAYSQILDAELKMNQALHKALEAKALMKRLMISEYHKVKDYLPSKNEVYRLQNFFDQEYNLEADSVPHFDSYIRSIKTVDQLNQLLAGQVVVDGAPLTLNEDDIRNAVIENMHYLLKTKWNFRKSRRFFQTLYNYVTQKNIVLTGYDYHKLRKNCFSFFARFCSKEYRNHQHQAPLDFYFEKFTIEERPTISERSQ